MEPVKAGLRKAGAADFQINKPLQESVYDENGTLLLRAGYVITMPSLASRLLERGCYIGQLAEPGSDAASGRAGEADNKAPGAVDDAAAVAARRPPPAPVFFRTSDLATSVRRIHKFLCEPPSERINIKDYVSERAQSLMALVDEDPDSVLASCYLTPELADYRPGHQLLGAAIVALLAVPCGLTAGQRLSLVCAALTRDVALNTFDQTWATARELPDEARNIIRAHPLVALKILHAHGINDADWLRFIEEHHERPDGKGYPKSLAQADLHPGSMLLALADSYASMVLHSPRAAGVLPANAIKELFLEKGSRYDERQVAVLFKCLTRFPAGTLVSLANGEVGVVKNPDKTGKSPMVFSIYDRSGMPRSSPTQRDTALPEFAITGCVLPSKCKSASLVIRRLWQAGN